MSGRQAKKISIARPTLEGAGVHLRRAFGFGDTAETDPFLLLDDFRGDRPEDYRAGFPWHPHRGIETITYVLAGTVEHADSIGNSGAISAGDVQWMTAGSGIMHQEMPKGDEVGRMYGFQLWANLPASLKMTKPRYQDVKSRDIPEVTDDTGAKARIICGTFWGKRGPVEGIAADPSYVDLTVPAGVRETIAVDRGRNVFAYVFAGSGRFSDGPHSMAENHSLVLFGDGDEISLEAGPDGVRFILASGKPLREPVAWSGPIVMNTQEELEQAFEELRRGTFLR